MTYPALGEGSKVSWSCDTCGKSGIAQTDTDKKLTAERVALNQHTNCNGNIFMKGVK
jgi:hypothetical protein